MMPSTPSPRLSTRAHAILTLAHELGRREPGVEPNSGHVLIALAREGGSVVEDTLSTLSVSYEDVLSAVAIAGSAPDAKAEMTALLAAAGRVAGDHGQIVIAAPYLLAASAQDDTFVAARAIASLGIAREQIERHLWANRDMLVPLLALPDPTPALERARHADVRIRRARAWEAPAVQRFITTEGFADTWAPETANAFARQPISIFVAERAGVVVGFAAYDCGLRGIFGPTAVAKCDRAAGIASALLLRTLADMRATGYAYAIIGAVGPAEFYERVCGAVLLPSAWPSYVNWED